MNLHAGSPGDDGTSMGIFSPLLQAPESRIAGYFDLDRWNFEHLIHLGLSTEKSRPIDIALLS
jgi:hypothetical protein